MYLPLDIPASTQVALEDANIDVYASIFEKNTCILVKSESGEWSIAWSGRNATQRKHYWYTVPLLSTLVGFDQQNQKMAG